MAASLSAMVNNEQPSREERYPGTWLRSQAVEVHVAYDSYHKPYVLQSRKYFVPPLPSWLELRCLLHIKNVPTAT